MTPDWLREAESAGEGWGDFTGDDADGSAADVSMLAQLLIDQTDRVGGNRKSYAFAAARLRGDHGVHADDLAIDIDQRPAGVAGIDGRVGLQINHRSGAVDLALGGADDAHGHRVFKAERAAKCESKLADVHLVGVGQFERRQIGSFHLEQGKIGQRVAPQNPGG